MYRERLEMMRDLLREDAANPEGAQFDLGTWASASPGLPGYAALGAFAPEQLGLAPVEVEFGHDYHRYPLPADKLPKVSCGTTACALGLAAISRRFEKFGLGMEYRVHKAGNVSLIPNCGGAGGFDAGAVLFGISYEDSRYFFDPDCYDYKPMEAEGELFVAQRIDDFLNGDVDERWHPGCDAEDNYDEEEPEED